MSVKNPAKAKLGRASAQVINQQPLGTPRYKKPGYAERYRSRQMNVSPAKPSKSVLIAKGSTRVDGSCPGAGAHRPWQNHTELVPNEYLQGNRGCKRVFERTGGQHKRSKR